MKLGAATEYIRKTKNMTVNTLINGIVSRSTYNRFVKDETKLSFSKFTELSNRLRIDAEDILSLHESVNIFNREELYCFDWVDLSTLSEYDREQLLSAKFFIIKLAQADEYYNHVNWYLDLILNHRYQIPIGQRNLVEMESYLLNMPTWYHYEFALLSHTMHHFEEAILYKALDQAEVYLDKEIYLDYTQVVFNVCSNIYFHFISKGMVLDLERFTKLIGAHPRSHIFFKQRVMLRFYQLLLESTDKKFLLKEVKSLVNNCQQLGANTVADELMKKFQFYLAKHPI